MKEHLEDVAALLYGLTVGLASIGVGLLNQNAGYAVAIVGWVACVAYLSPKTLAYQLAQARMDEWLDKKGEKREARRDEN